MPPRLFAITAFAAAQDRLGRAVVLLELDHARVGEVVLEVQDVLDVGAAEAVDGVMGQETVRNEIVSAIDVKVVHIVSYLNWFH